MKIIYHLQPFFALAFTISIGLPWKRNNQNNQNSLSQNPSSSHQSLDANKKSSFSWLKPSNWFKRKSEIARQEPKTNRLDLDNWRRSNERGPGQEFDRNRRLEPLNRKHSENGKENNDPFRKEEIKNTNSFRAKREEDRLAGTKDKDTDRAKIEAEKLDEVEVQIAEFKKNSEQRKRDFNSRPPKESAEIQKLNEVEVRLAELQKRIQQRKLDQKSHQGRKRQPSEPQQANIPLSRSARNQIRIYNQKIRDQGLEINKNDQVDHFSRKLKKLGILEDGYFETKAKSTENNDMKSVKEAERELSLIIDKRKELKSILNFLDPNESIRKVNTLNQRWKNHKANS